MSTDLHARAASSGTGIYYVVFAILVVATFVTWQVAYLDLGRLNTVVALIIAAFKATLVVWFFMHARSSPRLILLVAFGGLLWLGILIALTAGDYLTR
ncbi:MAG TPA: cytochrome C oxidase subunit IV family protein [Vicinamibacterales bacterium]|nr:cytochrome C oxidase subunit IV family protein [Vicinamibacterales bacterium]